MLHLLIHFMIILGCTEQENMKIFNWVHRRLHHNVLKDGFAKNMKKTESIAIDNNTKDLRQQLALVDVFESWRDGVLAIGTFGFDSLEPVDVQNDENDDQHDHHYDDEEIEDEEEEEVNPLMFTKFENNFEEITSFEDDDNDNDIKNDNNVGRFDEINVVDDEKKTRTTLADLFMADSVHVITEKNEKLNSVEFRNDPREKWKTISPTKDNTGISHAKKVIPQQRDDSRPVKKIRHMMKRMLKRKIHPDFDQCKAENNLDDQNESNKDVNESVGESVSLLQTSVGGDARI